MRHRTAVTDEFAGYDTHRDPALYNEDLAPTEMGKRTWSTYTFAALWISMAH